MKVEGNLRRYLADRSDPSGRYASFDYCYNYFQAHRETGVPVLREPPQLQISCLHLGFFLASWGMFRGSGKLLTRSARCFVPVIEAIVEAPTRVWDIDADCYTDEAVETIMAVYHSLGRVLPGGHSQTLVTKTMLGVFGCVPAFDTYVMRNPGMSTFGPRALRRIRDFYQEHTAVIDANRAQTLDFDTGKPTDRRDSRAKVIDAALYIEGGGP